MVHQDESADCQTRVQEPNDPHDENPWGGKEFGLLVLLFLFIFTHRGIQGQNDLSRFVAIGSLINRETWQIDGSAWAEKRQTRDGRSYMLMNDVVKHPHNGHLYSSKPPVLSFMAAGILRIFQWVGAQFHFQRPYDAKPTFLLTWLVVGSLAALAFYGMRREAGRLLPSRTADLATVLALGGTLFLAYSTTFNNHTVAATLILTAFFGLGMAEGNKEPPLLSVLGAGFCMGWALVIDIPAGGAFGLAFGLYIIFHLRSIGKLSLLGIGALPAFLLHCGIQYSIWESILPVQVMDNLGHLEGSYWQNPIGPDTWNISRWKYCLLTLFSMRGLFTLSPILLFGVAGLADNMRNGDAETLKGTRGRKIAAFAVGFGVLVNIIYYSFEGPTNFGGSCFGFRWYIGFTPLLSWYAISYFASHRDDERVRRLFYILGLISVTYALIGMQDPWQLMENNAHPAVRILLLLRGFAG
ncbi:MAG: hypothetical protein KGZ25_06910 [Planctomycetes bacterium]|nr:hypothetical protein [Planctomycetota bacterium]